jgi:hypothetical protein
MMRVPVKNPIESRRGPTDLDTIQIEETTSSNNPEYSTPQVGSPGEVSSYLEIARISGRTSTLNPMFNIITIYDDEESSEVSLVTSMKITEEIEPEKASTPGPDDPSQRSPQNDHEVESALDAKPLDI